MMRRAFTMRLQPGGLAEYKRNHDAIWQELVDEIEAHVPVVVGVVVAR